MAEILIKHAKDENYTQFSTRFDAILRDKFFEKREIVKQYVCNQFASGKNPNCGDEIELDA